MFVCMSLLVDACNVRRTTRQRYQIGTAMPNTVPKNITPAAYEQQRVCLRGKCGQYMQAEGLRMFRSS